MTFDQSWVVTEYEGTWTSLDEFGPGLEVPGEDVLEPPDFDAFLVMNSMAIGNMTPADWLAAFDEIVSDGLPEDCPGVASEGTVAGEPATVMTQECDDAVYVGRSVTHAGRGYYFTVRVPQGDDALAAAFDTVVQSIEFVD